MPDEIQPVGVKPGETCPYCVPGPLCTRCGHRGHDCYLRIEAEGCFTGTQGELLSLLEAPRLSKAYRMLVAQMIREGLGLCLEPHCGMIAYRWGPPSGYCNRHESMRDPDADTERQAIDAADAGNVKQILDSVLTD